MAVPKRRVSNSRRKMRRAHLALKPSGVSECKSCGQFKLPHRICPHCGVYKGKEIIAQTAE